MAASFNSFVSTIKQSGIAKQYYYCEISAPPSMVQQGMLSEMIPFYVMALNLPEFGLITQSIKDNGLTREVAVDKSYGTVTMTFFSDQDMTIKNFFDLWLKSTIVSNGGKFQYPSEYTAATMTLTQMNSSKNASYKVVLNNVYPKAVSDVSLSADSAAPLAFSISWVYESWDSSNIPSDNYAASLAAVDNQFQNQTTIGDAQLAAMTSISRDNINALAGNIPFVDEINTYNQIIAQTTA